MAPNVGNVPSRTRQLQKAREAIRGGWDPGEALIPFATLLPPTLATLTRSVRMR